MKRLLFLLIATTVAACEKPCEEYAPSDMAGEYQSSSGAYMNVVIAGENRIRIDDHFTGTIIGCGEVDVIEQIYPHPIGNYDISVSGSLTFEIDNPILVNGQISGGGKKFRANLTYQFQGQTINDYSTYNYQ